MFTGLGLEVVWKFADTEFAQRCYEMVSGLKIPVIALAILTATEMVTFQNCLVFHLLPTTDLNFSLISFAGI